MSFWDTIASPFKAVGRTIFNIGSGVYNGVKGVVNFGTSTVKKVVDTGFDTIKTVVHMPEKIIGGITHTVDKVDNSINNVTNSIDNLSKSPVLIIAGVAALGFIILK